MIDMNNLPLGMDLDRVRATMKVARQIRAAETQIDKAGIEMMRLGIVMLEAREEAALSATYGHQQVTEIVAAIGSWSLTRNSTVAAHKGLERISMKLGTSEVAYGDGGEKPSYAPPVVAVSTPAAAVTA